ncbi:MAG: hypothetical protein ACREQI_06105 [Candidatus Binataceae bacterium]
MSALAIALAGTAAFAAPAPSEPCNPPTKIIHSSAETAWRLFIAANCPVNSNQYPYVVWENWIEQSQLYPTNPASGLHVPNSAASESDSDGESSHPLHANAFAVAMRKRGAVRAPILVGTQCNPANDPPTNNPNLVICEEVRLNGAAEDYIAGRNLWDRAGQAALAAQNGSIQFSKPALELKLDWLQLDSCSNPPPGVHVEQIGDRCFALAGINITSKLVNNWLWATFEPQNLDTNPNRCVVLGCNDKFGSNPAHSQGGAGGVTEITPSLRALMAQANLALEWQNYRLDGVQTTFTMQGRPTLLGNSIIEGENVGVPLERSSCISCHAYSSVKSDGTDGFSLLTALPADPIGKVPPLPAGWTPRDFVWSLGLACPSGDGLQGCTN